MRIYRGIEEAPGAVARAMTVGNFDGLHRGHRAIIRRLLSRASAEGLVPAAMIFEPHPQMVLRGTSPPALSSPEAKMELLGEAGVQELVVARFDAAMAALQPEDFVAKVLIGSLGVASIVVGSNFRFGHMARGDATMLRTLAAEGGFFFEAVRLLELAGRRVSSTEVRHALGEGDLEWANRALGRPFRIEGRVVRGAGRGRRLGFPTANIAPPPGMCIPRTGVYAGHLQAGGLSLPAAVSIGTNPTFGGEPLSVEAHALDFDADLYGSEAGVDLVERLRDEETFSSEAALVEAVRADIDEVRSVLHRRRAKK